MKRLLYIIIALTFSLSSFAQTESRININPGQSADSKAFLRGVALYSEGQFESAYSVFTLLNELYPDDDAVAYYRGCCAAMLEKVDIAETQLLKATQMDTSNTYYLYALTAFYRTIDKPYEFAHYSERLINQAPEYMNSPELLSEIADGQLLAGKDSLALKLFDRLLEIIPDYPPAILSKMYIYRRSGKLVNFFVCLEQLIENEDIKTEFKCEYLKDLVDNMTAQFYWVWGDTLLKIIDRNLELFPEQPVAHLLRINFNIIKGENQEAIQRAEKMVEVAKNKADKHAVADGYALIGDLQHQESNKKKAYKAYEEALKYNPDLASVLNNYAYYLSEDRKELKKALKMSTRVIELEPDNATYLDTHGWILFLLNRAEEAKPFFKHAMLYGGKESAVVLDHYSQVLEKLGESSLAKYYKSLSEQKQK